MTNGSDLETSRPKISSYETSTDVKSQKALLYLKKLMAFLHINPQEICKELERLLANVESSFIHQRSYRYLVKLACHIYFTRKNLNRNKALFPYQDCCDACIFPITLQFTFGTKSVLGILSHTFLRDKYEIFDEEQILFAIQKILPDASIIKDSIYFVQPVKSQLKTLYFEIEHHNGDPFDLEKVLQLKQILPEKIQSCVLEFVPKVFMVRNEEEVLKSILSLSQEIRSVKDLPQVMIIFEDQTIKEAIFTVVLVKVNKALNNDSSQLDTFFKSFHQDLEYNPERCQIVRYLRNKYPIEAHVFRLKIKKNPSLLRTDMSLNFYLAREKISHFLTQAIGEFRDYNGGMINKQREILNFFKDIFKTLSHQDRELLENLYYSLNPIESQATLPLNILSALFALFLKAREISFSLSSDFFYQIHKEEQHLLIFIRIADPHFTAVVNAIFDTFEPDEKVAFFNMELQKTDCSGYILRGISVEKEKKIDNLLTEMLKNWKEKIDSLQILRLGLEHPVVSLDPRIGGDQVSALILKALFEGLMRMNREGHLEKGLVDHIEISSDQKTYLFHLKLTFWTNGNLVSAYDFDYAWKKILSPSFKTPFAYLFYPIKNAKLAKSGLIGTDSVGIQALDDLTLKVDLEFPCSYFLELTSHTIYSPINRLIDQKRPSWASEDKELYVCNGAFYIQKNCSNEEYHLVKNFQYWDANNIKLDEIKIVKTDRYNCYEMFKKGVNHWIGSPMGVWDSTIGYDLDVEEIVFMNASVYWFSLNAQKIPFNNKKIRKAFAFSIDHQKLKHLFNIIPATSPLPPMNSFMMNSNPNTYHLDKARHLFEEGLKELNLSRKDLKKVSIVYLTGPNRDLIANFIKNEWETVFGIQCSVKPLDWKTLFGKVLKGDYEVGGILWSSWVNDPSYTLNAFRDKNEPVNIAKWENNEYKDLLYEAQICLDIQKKTELYKQAEMFLIEESPVIPIFINNICAFKQKNFHISCSSSLMDFKWGIFN